MNDTPSDLLDAGGRTLGHSDHAGRRRGAVRRVAHEVTP